MIRKLIKKSGPHYEGRWLAPVEPLGLLFLRLGLPSLRLLSGLLQDESTAQQPWDEQGSSDALPENVTTDATTRSDAFCSPADERLLLVIERWTESAAPAPEDDRDADGAIGHANPERPTYRQTVPTERREAYAVQSRPLNGNGWHRCLPRHRARQMVPVRLRPRNSSRSHNRARAVVHDTTGVYSSDKQPNLEIREQAFLLRARAGYAARPLRQTNSNA